MHLCVDVQRVRVTRFNSHATRITLEDLCFALRTHSHSHEDRRLLTTFDCVSHVRLRYIAAAAVSATTKLDTHAGGGGEREEVAA